MSSNSTSLAPISNLIQARDQRLGLNLSSRQAVTVPSNLKSEVVIIPSTSQPVLGSYFIFDVKERNTIISDLVVNFNMTAISGRTGDATNYPHFNPATFWIQKAELVINNVTIDTLYPIQQFTSQQFFNSDEDRIYINNMQGNYASVAQRAYLASNPGQNYYIKLRSFYNEAHIPNLSDSHNLQVRVYMSQLTEIVALSGGTGTAVATINYANLICKVIKIPVDIATSRYNSMIKKPEQSFFHNVRYSPFSVNFGVSATTIVLSPFIGNVIALFFVVRPSVALTMDSSYQFTAINNFALLDSTSSNCVGGQAIPSQLALQYLNSFHSKSSYTTETSIGSNLAGSVINNSANVYCWSFSSNVSEALENGLLLGHRKFVGNEQLQISFASNLGTPVQIDVWAYCQSVLEQGGNYIKVMAL